MLERISAGTGSRVERAAEGDRVLPGECVQEAAGEGAREAAGEGALEMGGEGALDPADDEGGMSISESMLDS